MAIPAARFILAQEATMRKRALVFALASLLAGLLGSSGIAAGAAGIAKLLCLIFLVLFAVCQLLGVTVFRALK
ncbi:DUF1328 family protein [Cupriavidus malaysiensis]